MKARWVELKQPGQMAGAQTWAAVDEDDEIIATVAGSGMLWGAATTIAGAGFQNGSFISLKAGQDRVQKWLGTYQFYDPNATNWAYTVAP